MDCFAKEAGFPDGYFGQLAYEPLDARVTIPSIRVGQHVLDVAVQVELFKKVFISYRN